MLPNEIHSLKAYGRRKFSERLKTFFKTTFYFMNAE